jgi:hydroxylaminobenzene mutase
MEAAVQRKQSDRLIFWGIFLFLLGLIVGLIVPKLANPRMGLSSHIEGVLNGMFLIILGLIWHKLHIGVKWLKIAFLLAIYGTFLNWFSMLIAAVFDAGKMLTIAANGQEGHPLVEGFITFSLLTLSLAMIAICIIVLVGLKGSE